MGKKSKKQKRLERKQFREKEKQIKEFGKKSWQMTKPKGGYRDVDILQKDPHDLSKLDYIDKHDSNAKILKDKNKSRALQHDFYMLIEKEENGTLTEDDIKKFRLVVDREPNLKKMNNNMNNI
ncbi:MAG: hypothetical protein Q8M95_15200 [Candidatus Methanoperedens sp.]|nr:hypothetical protein [Candidatus Methanoperedens sp.]